MLESCKSVGHDFLSWEVSIFPIRCSRARKILRNVVDLLSEPYHRHISSSMRLTMTGACVNPEGKSTAGTSKHVHFASAALLPRPRSIIYDADP